MDTYDASMMSAKKIIGGFPFLTYLFYISYINLKEFMANVKRAIFDK